MARLKHPRPDQPTLFDTVDTQVSTSDFDLAGRSSTFADNLTRPIHRWFRYSAGFSADWARHVIEQEKRNGRTRVLDPFVGSGTVVLEAEASGIEAIGAEAHPFVRRVAATKLLWRSDIGGIVARAEDVLSQARAGSAGHRNFPPLLTKCFPPEALKRLDSLRSAWAARDDGSAASELTWLALASILRECSPVGTAQWQYVLPRKSKSRAVDPFTAFRAKVGVIAGDMAARQRLEYGPAGRILADDARELPGVPAGWADLIVTSPPYANNYDYADATRLEMTFFGEIEGWGELQDAVRRYLVRACTQHVSPLVKQTADLIGDAAVAPITGELTAVCEQLGAVREERDGKKPYHTMVAAYFRDMAHVWRALRRAATAGCRVCFVVGDSAPYGVYVPVDRWLGLLAVAAGFKSFRFEKTRDRNVKWRNRKHRVPLHEGRLWVEG